MQESDFNKVFVNLKNIHELGVLQLSAHKESRTDKVRRRDSFIQIEGIWFPEHVAVAKLISDPETFLFENTEQYWNLYRTALDIFGSPGVQFMMRPVMEMAYSRIVLYSQKSADEQRRLALKFWLCINGLSIHKDVKSYGNNFKPEDYDALVQLLPDENDRIYFKDLKAKGYPFSSFHQKLHILFPSILDPNVKETLSEILGDLWDNASLRQYPIDRQVRSFSMYVHGNPIILRNLESERESRNYVLRCAKILQFTGISILKISEKKFKISILDQAALMRLKDEFGVYLFQLWESSRREK